VSVAEHIVDELLEANPNHRSVEAERMSASRKDEDRLAQLLFSRDPSALEANPPGTTPLGFRDPNASHNAFLVVLGDGRFRYKEKRQFLRNMKSPVFQKAVANLKRAALLDRGENPD
jgi:hypothetical protein